MTSMSGPQVSVSPRSKHRTGSMEAKYAERQPLRWFSMDAEEPFDYELTCGDCGTDLGTFLRGEDFAEEPHECPECHSRHLLPGDVPRGKEWSRWETVPVKDTTPTPRLRFLLTR